jgi:hypothetical protein
MVPENKKKTEDTNKLPYGGNPTTPDSCSVIDS